MHVYLIAGAAVWGTAGGLLLPRAAYRLAVEADQPWASRCPAGHPVRGWLGQARCSACANGRAYGPGYGAAAAAAVACAALAAVVGAHPELAVWLLLVPVGVLLAWVDLKVFRLPDVLTLPALGAAVALLGLASLLHAHDGSWTRALVAAGVLGALYFVLFFVNPAGLGFGDVKLAPTMGLALGWYGWGTLFLGTMLGFGLGAVLGLALIATRRADRKTPIPFGPFILGGALAALLLT
ncbi:prepilin peptidase [Actinacidiphila rubida]|uniref:Leader peptidase (Prepilin peptidase) / N-methyltransferase n=1 Tax=Actinacidiphila rubida TaxID=310780 RepID=A0A1H8HHJ9_9ACTN|nr:A24 family peptidase [Actinacidiphila rubida]SEN55519.1 leader peptidase (prepilin peptidase) / N-methyltransferase [Actinacidiphila rubida]